MTPLCGWLVVIRSCLTRLPSWLPAPPRLLAPEARLPWAGPPRPGSLTPAAFAGKDMEPYLPVTDLDEGPPTPGSATKVPPVRARLWGPEAGGLPRGNRKCPRQGSRRPAPATPALCSESRRLPELESQRELPSPGCLSWRRLRTGEGAQRGPGTDSHMAPGARACCHKEPGSVGQHFLLWLCLHHARPLHPLRAMP